MADQRMQQLLTLQAKRKQQIEEQKKKIDEMKARRKEKTSSAKGYENIIQELLPEGTKEIGQLKPPQALASFVPEDGSIDIFPGLGETYTKACQTEKSGTDYISSDEDVDRGRQGRRKSDAGAGGIHKPVVRKRSSMEFSPADFEIKDKKGMIPKGTMRKDEFTEEEKNNIMSADEFKDFFDRTSKIVEKMLLGSGFTDYSQVDVATSEGGAERMVEVCDFVSENWTQGRVVTDIQFSEKFPELLCASYGSKKHSTVSDDDGVVAVWSLGLTTRPEFVLTAGSPVLCVRFEKFNPALYLGGTYSGSIVLWDTRTPQRTPVQRTPLVSRGHTHPVYTMQQIGTVNANNLVSVSTDGKLCVWTLSMLVHPQEVLELKKGNRELVVHSLSFPPNETNTAWVGSEDGSISQVQVHGAASKNGVVDSLEGHEGPVTNVALHQNDVFQNDLLLSSSFDWSVNLYSTRYFQSPILTLQHYEDYVCDVKWHPTHPGVFTTIDASGLTEIWNLNEDMETAVIRNQAQNTAWHRCDWDSTGRRLAIGDIEGKISIWQLHDPKIVNPKPDEASILKDKIKTLEPIQQQKYDTKILY